MEWDDAEKSGRIFGMTLSSSSSDVSTSSMTLPIESFEMSANNESTSFPAELVVVVVVE